MEKKADVLKNIDEYIAQFPIEVQEKLQRIRKVVLEAAPDATEKTRIQALENGVFTVFSGVVIFLRLIS
ncbi:MAG: hypothetical protein APF76_01085 [Desulfitibacter sp. BRH_c19]|nr:MAG: hypothetical protein APF76_01085 [Desulfitibacter sp. BRH_c19]